MKKAIVVGAGIGGLSSAIRLAHQGWQVQVFEQNSGAGGKMSEYQAQGFRWDMGPSVITMRHVIEGLFNDVGRTLTDYLTLLPLNPLTRYFYPDGTQLNVTSNLTEMLNQIDDLEPRDVEGYLRYLSYVARIYRITAPVFIENQPPKLHDFLSVPVWEMPHVDPLRTMSQSIQQFVKHPKLQQLLGRFATYTGASPYLAPATLNVIAHVELNQGVWYPQGGIYSIAKALEQVAVELGVHIHYNHPVKSILTQHGVAYGVALADDTPILSDIVLANADVGFVYDKLIRDQSSALQQHTERLLQMEPSCSGLIFMWGIDRSFSELAHHNILFSQDYAREFHQLFTEQKMPDDPTIYLAITSKTDSSHAPAGCENWFVLVNAPALSPHFDWNAQLPSYRERVLDKLSDFGLNIRPHLKHERILTPHDLERLTNARRGALYGTSSNNRFAAFNRPHNRSQHIDHLYFVGGTTHPGGGVPMVMLSAKVVTEMIQADFA